MMPDLGNYAVSVLLAYAATFVALAVFIAVSFQSDRKGQKQLRAKEANQDG